jgi:hypothetical protein
VQRPPLGRLASLLLATALGGGSLLLASLLLPEWMTSGPCRFLVSPGPASAMSSSDVCRGVLVWGGHLLAGITSAMCFLQLRATVRLTAVPSSQSLRFVRLALTFTGAYLLVSLAWGIAAVYAVLHALEPVWTIFPV